MEHKLSKMFVIIIIASSIAMAGSIAAIVCSALFVLAKGSFAVGVAMIICFSLLFLASVCTFGICISWKKSSRMIYKFDNGKPDFYQQQKIDEEVERLKNLSKKKKQ